MKKKTIVIGVTGGIATYKALEVISKLNYLGYETFVIMTKNAEEFVCPLSFETLSKNPVATNMFESKKTVEVEHIALAQKADLFLIVPATANIVGKVANGIADDMLSTTIMATEAPVLFALAMNEKMYTNAIVQHNLSKLLYFGYSFISPAAGMLACGDVGIGKLVKTDDIVKHVQYILEKSELERSDENA